MLLPDHPVRQRGCGGLPGAEVAATVCCRRAPTNNRLRCLFFFSERPGISPRTLPLAYRPARLQDVTRAAADSRYSRYSRYSQTMNPVPENELLTVNRQS